MPAPAVAPQPYSEPIHSTDIPVSQPAPRLPQTTLDICIQRITSQKPEYLSLYIHPTACSLDNNLMGVLGKTTYRLDIPLDTWKKYLEQALQNNDLTKHLVKDANTIQTPPKYVFPYVFPYNLYFRIAQILLPHFPPPFWDTMKKKESN